MHNSQYRCHMAACYTYHRHTNFSSLLRKSLTSPRCGERVIQNSLLRHEKCWIFFFFFLEQSGQRAISKKEKKKKKKKKKKKEKEKKEIRQKEQQDWAEEQERRWKSGIKWQPRDSRHDRDIWHPRPTFAGWHVELATVALLTRITTAHYTIDTYHYHP